MEFEVTAGEQKVKSGDTGVRGKLALQLMGAQCTRSGQMVIRLDLNRFNYDTIDEPDETSGLTMPVVYRRARSVPAKETTPGAVYEKGKWVVKIERERLEPDYPDITDVIGRYKRLVDKVIYLRCKVIWPEESYSEVVPCSVVIKGIEFPKGPNTLSLNFITDPKSGFMSGFMKLCVAFGFQPGKLFPDDPTYDPDYIMPYVHDLEFPLTVEQVVQRFLVPILVRHGQEGHLARGETSEKSHFLVRKSIKAMSEADARKTWEGARAWEAAKEPEPEPELAPFPDDDDDDPSLVIVDGVLKADVQATIADPASEPTKREFDGSPEAEKLRGEVRTLAAGDPDFALNVGDFLDEQGIAYDDESLLNSLNAEELARVIEHFSPKKKAPAL